MMIRVWLDEGSCACSLISFKCSEPTIHVRAGFCQVNEFKAELLRKMGPSSLTGLNMDNLILYERGVQPGRPLEVTDCSHI